MRTPYAVNYSLIADLDGLYKSRFHAQIDKAKDCYVWAWVFENGTGFESNEHTVNTDGKLISYYYLTTHPNFTDGIYLKDDSYSIEISPEDMINTMKDYLSKVKEIAQWFINFNQQKGLKSIAINQLALKIDYLQKSLTIIHNSEISDEVYF